MSMNSEPARITLCELPVFRGRSIDIAKFGKPLSHTFLAFHRGNDIRELHASWSTPNVLERKLPSRIIELSTSFMEAKWGSVGRIALKAFDAAVFNSHRPLNIVTESAEKAYDRAVSEIVVYEEDLPKAESVWDDLIEIGKGFHAMQIPYARYGMNCQFLTRGILEACDHIDSSGITLSLADCGWSSFEHSA